MKLFICTVLMLIFMACFNKKNSPERRVKHIHDKALTVDTHCDTPSNLLNTGFDIGIENEAPRRRLIFPG